MYRQFLDFKLSDNTVREIQALNYLDLNVSTFINSYVVFDEIIKTQFSISFFKKYGIFLQYIADLKNLHLPKHIEQEISNNVAQYFNTVEKPIVRMQTITKGTIVPLHVDATRESSFVIPISGHNDWYTCFYNTSKINKRGLVNPRSCKLNKKIKILYPTLISTNEVHSVEFEGTTQIPRISITAKWEKITFDTIINAKNHSKI